MYRYLWGYTRVLRVCLTFTVYYSRVKLLFTSQHPGANKNSRFKGMAGLWDFLCKEMFGRDLKNRPHSGRASFLRVQLREVSLYDLHKNKSVMQVTITICLVTVFRKLNLMHSELESSFFSLMAIHVFTPPCDYHTHKSISYVALHLRRKHFILKQKHNCEGL
jgi:hypothetical protein